jgi:hypothetical protein
MEEQKPKQDPSLILNNDGTASWTFREEGDTLQATYAGTFVFKCYLSPLETLASGRLFRELIGQNSNEASDQERFLAFSLSQLKSRIVKAPPFWKTDSNSIVDGNIPDLNLISLTLDKAINAELLYKEELKKKKAEAVATVQAAATALQESLKPTRKKKEKE